MEVSKEVLFVDENNSDLNGNANLSQTDVDEVLAELKAAVEGLLLHGVKTSLRELLTLAEAVVEAEYTTSTYSVFKNALDAAMVVDNKADNLTTQAEVNEVFTPLDNAYKALVKRGNKSEMISKIDQYKTIVSSDYTASSYNAFKTAFDEAKAVNDNIDALQAEIDAALEDLTTKASSLVALGNKTELYNTISEAEALKKDDYKAENWEDLIEALDYAKSVSESNDVSEEDVEEANTLLKEAIESLQKKKKGCLSTTIMQSVLTGFSLMFALFIVRRRRF
jgi:hyaluronoglucosaminidase